MKKDDGTFPSDWAFQWFTKDENRALEILKGDGEWVIENSTEQKLVTTSRVIYVRSYDFKTDPCEDATTYDITFNLTVAEDVPEEVSVYLAGGFPENNWMDNPIEMTRVDAKHFTVEVKDCPLGKDYKYAANATWDNEMYLTAPAEGDTCVAKLDGNLSISDVIVEDAIAGFVGVTTELPFCGKEDEPVVEPVEVNDGDELVINVTVAEDLALTDGLYVYSWSHSNAGCAKMELVDGVYTYTFTVAEGDAASWDNTGMLFVDVNVDEVGWDAKGGQTTDIKPIHAGDFVLNADWTVSAK